MVAFNNVSNSEYTGLGRKRLEEKIQNTRAASKGVFDRVFSNAPKDALVKAKATSFLENEVGNVVISYGKVQEGIHNNALSQISGKMGIPSMYLSELAHGKPWQRALAVKVLNEHFQNVNPDSRYLVRTVHQEVRGFLSDRYRRLDSRPLLEAFASSCERVGAQPVDGVVSDVRVSLKALLPHVFEPVPGEVMALGVEWANSDFGVARHTLRGFMLRLMCLNGATLEDALTQVHLGKVLTEDIEFSQQTYELDTKTSVSALKDVVQNLLAPEKVQLTMDGIKSANEKRIEWKDVKTQLQKKLLKSELKAVEDAFKGEDVINLPSGQTTWRASNAVSWLAGSVEDPDRKLELQRIAGEVFTGKTESALTEVE